MGMGQKYYLTGHLIKGPIIIITIKNAVVYAGRVSHGRKSQVTKGMIPGKHMELASCSSALIESCSHSEV